MKVCVFGAGAVGGFLAATLHEAGHDISLVIRGPHLKAVKKNGLRVTMGDKTVAFNPPCSDNPADLDVADVVIVTTKATAIPEVAKKISPLLGPDTMVAFVINGIPWWYFYGVGGELEGRRIECLDPGNVAWDQIGPERVIGGVINTPCTVVEPGVIDVEMSALPYKLLLGEPAAKTSERLRALVAAFKEPEIMSVTASEDIRHDIWAKLVLNLSSGPLSAITEARLKDIFSSPICADARRRIHREAADIAEAMGYPVPLDIEGPLKSVQRSEHRVSLGQDMLLRRPLELDAMCRVPLDMARLCNVDTPTLDLVVELTRIRAVQEGVYSG